MCFSLTFLAVSWETTPYSICAWFHTTNFCMIPHVCSPTFGLNMSGWGLGWWRVMCSSKCLVCDCGIEMSLWKVDIMFHGHCLQVPHCVDTARALQCSIHCEQDISRWVSSYPPCSWWHRGEVATSPSSQSYRSYCWSPCLSSSLSARQATWRTNSTVKRNVWRSLVEEIVNAWVALSW